MKIGDSLDPIIIGHSMIDTKTLLKEAGYIVPQGSVAKLPTIPADVQKQIDELKQAQEKYSTCQESGYFTCTFCGARNYTNWRKEVDTGIEFLVCGDCHKVAEVR